MPMGYTAPGMPGYGQPPMGYPGQPGYPPMPGYMPGYPMPGYPPPGYPMPGYGPPPSGMYGPLPGYQHGMPGHPAAGMPGSSQPDRGSEKKRSSQGGGSGGGGGKKNNQDQGKASSAASGGGTNEAKAAAASTTPSGATAVSGGSSSTSKPVPAAKQLPTWSSVSRGNISPNVAPPLAASVSLGKAQMAGLSGGITAATLQSLLAPKAGMLAGLAGLSALNLGALANPKGLAGFGTSPGFMNVAGNLQSPTVPKKATIPSLGLSTGATAVAAGTQPADSGNSTVPKAGGQDSDKSEKPLFRPEMASKTEKESTAAPTETDDGTKPATEVAGTAKDDGSKTGESKTESKTEAKSGEAGAATEKETNEGSAEKPATPDTAAARKSLIRSVFRHCDNDGDGLLNEKEMLRLAVLTGFQGTVTKWTEEYQKLCSDNSRDPAAGVDIMLLEKLLNDTNDEGEHYTSDDELNAICKKLELGDKNGLEALMNARAAAEISGAAKQLAPTGPLAARLQTPKVQGLGIPPWLAMSVPKALQQLQRMPLFSGQPVKSGLPFSKATGVPVLLQSPRSSSVSKATPLIQPRVVPPPAMPPPSRISVRGIHVAMPMEAEESTAAAPEGSSPKVLGATPPGL